MVYITLDFGSSNSGALLNPIGQGYNRDELIYMHSQPALKLTKQPTEFWIKKELLESNFSNYYDALRIYSCVFTKEEHSENPNFIWCEEQIDEKILSIYHDSEWVLFRHPKMVLYNDKSDLKIKGSDGKFYPLSTILALFFSVIKKECLYVITQTGLHILENDINWVITVPGMAIWKVRAREFMRSHAKSVFGENVLLLSEPECALIGVNIGSGNYEHLVNDSYLLINDLGGGTSDISVLQVKIDKQKGETNFIEIKATDGEKDPTTSIEAGGNEIEELFILYFCTKLAKTDKSITDNSVVKLLWKEFKDERPDGAREFLRNWRNKIQWSQSFGKDSITSFSPGRTYLQWLGEHYPSIYEHSISFGDCEFATKELIDEVFSPVYNKVLNAIDEITDVIKGRGFEMEQVQFAGGLSLDKRLSKSIQDLIRSKFAHPIFSEIGSGVTIGAIQSGGNHIAVNKGLIKRSARKTFYTVFALHYNGDEKEFKDELFWRQRQAYNELDNSLLLSDDFLETEYQKQRHRMRDNIDYRSMTICYLKPMCLKYAKTSQVQRTDIAPIDKGNQTGTKIQIFSSDKNFLLFPGDYNDLQKENSFEYEFGYNWEQAEIVFDPTSNPVEGSAFVILKDANGRELHKENIMNVVKKGL